MDNLEKALLKAIADNNVTAEELRETVDRLIASVGRHDDPSTEARLILLEAGELSE